MVSNYLLATKTISKKLNEDHPMYPFMVCSLYGLLNKYNNHKKIVLDVFQKTDIIFEKGTIEEILERHNIDQDFVNPVHDSEETNVKTYAVSNPGHVFYFNKEGKICYSKDKPFVICSTDNISISSLLNSFCHEMGHLIKGEQNGIYTYQDNGYEVFVIRTGLAHNVYAYKNNDSEISYSANYVFLDEAINCIQTTDVMQEIIALEDIVDDKKIKNFIKSLDHEYLKKDYGYEGACLLVRELWKNDSFRKSVEENIVSGKIDTIISDYESIMGKDEFERMAQKLDDFYSLPDKIDDSTFNFYVDSFIEITKEYKERIKEKVKH